MSKVLYVCSVAGFQPVFFEVFKYFSSKSITSSSPINGSGSLPLFCLPILFSIRCGASEIQSRRGFDQLRQGQQDIISKLLIGQLAVSKDVASLLALSTDAIITEIHTSERRTAALQARVTNYGQRKFFLESLYFPEMLDRRDSIENRINDFGTTCRWIFNEERNREHGFLDWLESNSGVYWISGKPGSGKSSIMDYIIQNVQEHDVAVQTHFTLGFTLRGPHFKSLLLCSRKE